MKKNSGKWVLLFYISFIIKCEWEKVSRMWGLIPFIEYSTDGVLNLGPTFELYTFTNSRNFLKSVSSQNDSINGSRMEYYLKIYIYIWFYYFPKEL